MSEFHAILGGDEKTMIEEILYDQDSKSYFDFNLKTGELNKNYFASNYVPLYFYSKNGFPPNVDPAKRKSDLLSSLRPVFTIGNKKG